MKKLTFNLVIALLFGFFFTTGAFAQKPHTRIVTANDFLGKHTPAEVYDIETDSNGYVYFVYLGGLWRFNGRSVKTEWKTKNPYTPIYYTTIHKGYKDQILLSGPHGIAYVKGDSLLKFPVPDSIAALGWRGYESVYTDRNGLLHIAPRQRGYLTVDSLGNVAEISGITSNIKGFVATHTWDGQPFIYSISNKDVNSSFSLYMQTPDSNLIFISEIDYPAHASSLVQYQDGSFLFSNGKNDIIHFSHKGLLKAHKFDYIVHNLFIDSRNRLWIGTVNSGFFRADSSDLNDLQQFWNGASAVMTESFDNGIWFKSDETKFGYIPPHDILNYSEQNGYPEFYDIRKITLVEQQLLIENEKHELFLFNDNKVSPFNPPGIAHNQDLTRHETYPGKVCYDKKSKTLWTAFYGELQGWDGNNWEILKFNREEFSNIKVYDLQTLPDGRIVGTTQKEFFEIVEGEIVRISEPFNDHILEFEVDETGFFWVTGNTGLWILENGKFKRPFEKMPEQLTKPSLFMEYTQGAVWLQPALDGLYRIDMDSVSSVTDNEGRRIRLYAHSVSPNGDFWATISKKVMLCRIRTSQDRIDIKYFEFDDMVLANHYGQSLLATDTEIFIGGKEGLFNQKINRLKTQPPPDKIVINEVRINHEPAILKSAYELPFNKNYINITFDAIGFRRMSHEYSYQLVGLDTLWQETKYRQVQYTNLPPGDYTFKLRTKTSATNWTAPVVIQFFIAKPYWQTWWFRIGILSLSLSIIMFILWMRIRYIRKKETEKGRIELELSRLELRALKAQMNPHFIFNTLKSIQNRILNGGKWEANDLLVRFSKLIRASLEYSRNDFIPLQEEIDFLRNYLEIEKQRIPGKFDFEIIIDDEHELDGISIPSLLIQPICENAINYAFEENNGTLNLKLNLLSEDLLKVEISDDGIGYFNQKKTHNNEKISRGMKIVQSRLDLFRSHDYDTSILVEALDKTTNRGTKVTLKLPCQ